MQKIVIKNVVEWADKRIAKITLAKFNVLLSKLLKKLKFTTLKKIFLLTLPKLKVKQQQR